MTPSNWHPERPYDALPLLPPRAEIETKTVLRRCIAARGGGRTQAGVLREQPFGKEKLFLHPKLLDLLTRETNDWQPYAVV